MDKSIENHAQDRREERTRQALNQAIIALISEQDYELITVSSICERANVARKTFYEHYNGKHALMWDCTESLLNRLRQEMTALNPETLLMSGKPLSYPAFRHVQENAAIYRALLSQHSTSSFVLRLIEYAAHISYLQHAPLRASARHITLPPELIAHHLAGALLGTVYWWLQHDLQPPAEEMAYRFSQLAAPGVLDALGLS